MLLLSSEQDGSEYWGIAVIKDRPFLKILRGQETECPSEHIQLPFMLHPVSIKKIIFSPLLFIGWSQWPYNWNHVGKSEIMLDILYFNRLVPLPWMIYTDPFDHQLGSIHVLGSGFLNSLRKSWNEIFLYPVCGHPRVMLLVINKQWVLR